MFVAGEAVEIENIARALNLSVVETDRLVDSMVDEYRQHQRGCELIRLDDKVQMRTSSEYAEQVQQALKPTGERTLSRSALETLSIIAYNQPVTRSEIESIKGTNADYTVRALVSRSLIQPLGRKEVVGRPMMYGTTDEFLRHFGISTLKELPGLETFQGMEEIKEIGI